MRLCSGRVDVLAIEPTGRPVVIEVKLRNNTESRRAVVAQVLAYAAALHGNTAETFESDVLATQLAGRGLHDVVREAAQAEVPDAVTFQTTLDAALKDGALRVVLVLDRAPQELIRLVGYLEAVTHGLDIDLITVASYELEGRRFVVPQWVEGKLSFELGALPSTAREVGCSFKGHFGGAGTVSYDAGSSVQRSGSRWKGLMFSTGTVPGEDLRRLASSSMVRSSWCRWWASSWLIRLASWMCAMLVLCWLAMDRMFCRSSEMKPPPASDTVPF